MCYIIYTINSDLIPYPSIHQSSSTNGVQSGISSIVESHGVNLNNNNENTWNGGIIVTSEANKLSAPFPGRSETTIASTRCGNLIFIGFNSPQERCFDTDPNNPPCSGGRAQYTVSRDGGKTWKYLYGPPSLNTDLVTRGDPWMSMGGKSAQGTQELLYFANLAANRTIPSRPLIGIMVHVARIIYKNDNPLKNAIDFEWIRATLIPGTPPENFLDKQAIAADPFDSEKAYVSLTRIVQFTPYDRDLHVYSTHNAGQSWQGPVVLWKDNGSIFTAEFSSITVGSNGNVYVIWNEREVSLDFVRTLRYKFKKSTDGGNTFVPDKAIVINPEFTLFNPIAQPPVAHNRDFFPLQPTIDIFTTKYKKNCNYLNRIIIAYEYGLSDKFDSVINGFIDDNDTLLNSITFGISYSDDEGDTWHFIDPFINKPPIPQRFVKRKFPSVSVSFNGKSVNIAYIEIIETKKVNEPICEATFGTRVTRSSLYHSIANHYYIHSDDGGISWSYPIKLNDFSVDWCLTISAIRPNFGDYMLSISDRRGGIQVAGQTNGFTFMPYNSYKTVPDVIYFYSKRERCEKTKDCFGYKNNDITCSCYVKWNIDPFDKNNKFCCVKNIGMCQNDNDCCGGKTKCIGFKCLNTKQWRNLEKYNAITNVKYDNEDELLGFGDNQNVNVEIKLSCALKIVIVICCMGLCCGLPWFIWMRMRKQ